MEPSVRKRMGDETLARDRKPGVFSDSNKKRPALSAGLFFVFIAYKIFQFSQFSPGCMRIITAGA